MNRLAERLIPFIFLGIMLVAAVAGLFLLSWLIVLGAIAGMVLFAITRIRQYFVGSGEKGLKKSEQPGRTFDHDELQK